MSEGQLFSAINMGRGEGVGENVGRGEGTGEKGEFRIAHLEIRSCMSSTIELNSHCFFEFE